MHIHNNNNNNNKLNTLVLLMLCFLSCNSFASKVGDQLPALSFASEPHDFHYMANGKAQLITVYPAKASSMKNGDFNFRVQRLGICPIAVTDIFNKGWYVPKKMIEREMRKNVASKKHNPECKLSGDYEGLIVKAWDLKAKPVSIIVDGKGIVQFLEYGVLSESQQNKAIELLEP